MAANPASIPPQLILNVKTNTTDVSVVECKGRITSDTAHSLQAAVKPLFATSKAVVLDLTDVNHMDSMGLGAIVGLYVSAKTAKSQLKIINLNKRLRELFSLTRLGEILTEGRDPNYVAMP
jgi:anti-anti-sigma factor